MTGASGMLALLAAAACLGTSHVAEKIAIEEGAGPASIALLRGAVSLALVAAGWLLLRHAGRVNPPAARAIPHVALIGVLASGVAIALAILALRDTSATHKGVIQALYPVGTAAFAVALLGERLSWRSALALVAVTAGLLVLLSRGFQGLPNRGDWLLLLTVPVVGFSDTWAKRTLEDVEPLTLAAGRQLAGLAFLAVVFVLAGLGDLGHAFAAWPWIAFAGALAGGFVYLFYLGVERAGVTLAATVLAGAPAITAALEYAFLGSALSALQLAGLVLIVAGIVGLVRDTRS